MSGSTVPLFILDQVEVVHEIRPIVDSSSSAPSLSLSSAQPSAYSHSLAASKHNILLTVRSSSNFVQIIETNVVQNFSKAVNIYCQSDVIPSVSILEHRGRNIELNISFLTSLGIFHVISLELLKQSVKSSHCSKDPLVLPLIKQVETHKIPVNRNFIPKTITCLDAEKSIITTSSSQVFLMTSLEGQDPVINELKEGNLLTRAIYSKFSTSSTRNVAIAHYKCLGTDYVFVLSSTGKLALFSLRSKSLLIEITLPNISSDSEEIPNKMLLSVITEPTEPSSVKLAVYFDCGKYEVPEILLFAVKLPADPKRIRKPNLIATITLPINCRHSQIESMSSIHNELLMCLLHSSFSPSTITTFDKVERVINVPKFMKLSFVGGCRFNQIDCISDWICRKMIDLSSSLSCISSIQSLLMDSHVTQSNLIDAISSAAPTYPLSTTNNDLFSLIEQLPLVLSFLTSRDFSYESAVERLISCISAFITTSSKPISICSNPKLKQFFGCTTNSVFTTRNYLERESFESFPEELQSFGNIVSKFSKLSDHSMSSSLIDDVMSSDLLRNYELIASSLAPVLLGSDSCLFPIPGVDDLCEIFARIFNLFTDNYDSLDPKSWFYLKGSTRSINFQSYNLILRQLNSNSSKILSSFVLYLFCLTAHYSPLPINLIQSILKSLIPTSQSLLIKSLVVDCISNTTPLSQLISFPVIFDESRFPSTPLGAGTPRDSENTISSYFLSAKNLSQKCLIPLYYLGSTNISMKFLLNNNLNSSIQSIYRFLSINNEPQSFLIYSYGSSLLTEGHVHLSYQIFANLIASCRLSSFHDLEYLLPKLQSIEDTNDRFCQVVSTISELFYNLKYPIYAIKLVSHGLSLLDISIISSAIEKLIISGFWYATSSFNFSEALKFLNLIPNINLKQETARVFTNSIITSGNYGIFVKLFINESLWKYLISFLNNRLSLAVSTTDHSDSIIFDGIESGFALYYIFTQKSNHFAAADVAYRLSIIYDLMENSNKILTQLKPKFATLSAYNLACLALNSLSLANSVEGSKSDVFLSYKSNSFEKGAKIVGLLELKRLSSQLKLKLLFKSISGIFKSNVTISDFLNVEKLEILEQVVVYGLQLGLNISPIGERIGYILSQMDLQSPASQDSIILVKRILSRDSASINFILHSSVLSGYLAPNPNVIAPYWIVSRLKSGFKHEYERIINQFEF
ncbi:hypothetical protein RCL1_002841 [Eukaryota sp. TZLM3-RCL]